MRFIDANVFVHALLMPKRVISPEDKRLKEQARAILSSVEKGERVLTGVVHLSEAVNVFESYSAIGFENTKKVIHSILLSDHIEVAPVNSQDYSVALELALELKCGTNDALVLVLMRKHGLTELYSFDHVFDKVPGITRVTH